MNDPFKDQASKNMMCTIYKLLKGLAGIGEAAISSDIVVQGHWKTPDNVDVNISSVLVPPRKAKRLSKRLIDEGPFLVWLPTYQAYEGEPKHLRSDKNEYEPWIVTTETEGRLDADDPLTVIDTVRRPRFAEDVIRDYSLRRADPFARLSRARRKKVATSDAWGHEICYEERS